MTELIPNLYIGNWAEAQSCQPHGFHVVTVAVDSPHVGHQHFKLIDGPGNSQDEFDWAVRAVCQAHEEGRKVMVHCVGGRSRSAAVIVAAAVRITSRPFCELYDILLRVHDGPGRGARIHPHLALLLMKNLGG